MRISIFVLALGVLSAVGCTPTNEEYVTDARLEEGLVIILPGIEGEGTNSYNIRRGLLSSGVRSALPIYRWGRPVPLAGVLLNQTDFIGNRFAGGRIARFIENYQDSHPDRPVWLIGHSGGGGIAVFAAEELEEGRKIGGLVLLSASISGNYNLTKALSRCRHGIVNFSSQRDEILGATIFVGNVDGGRARSAGLGGFDKSPPGLR
ncbi:MAG: alpha/beta hydrolase, partial [Phycisphaerae bacterium]|nr:alpha/beta hydrolase [Phycisphaerae bacterium]